MIGVIGLGFVGLTTALGFAEKGFRVFCYDKDQIRLKTIVGGKTPFYEPYLDNKLKKHLHNNLNLCNTLEDLIQHADFFFYCVGTPSLKDGGADLSILKAAVEESLQIIKRNKTGPKTIIIKSTVPPSTTRDFLQPILIKNKLQIGKDIFLVNNPEFLREGYAWNDFIHPDRIIIGADDPESGRRVKEIYQSFNAPIFLVSSNTAEFIKYLSNTLLADLISFSNEMSIIADNIGNIDLQNAFNILHLDKRWNGSPATMTKYVYPGIGFGGYCLPKDIQALYTTSIGKGYTPDMLREIILVNTKIKKHFVTKIEKISQKKDLICFLGLSFKPNSDDVRDTPVKDIITMLLKDGYTNIIATDPVAVDNFKNTYHLPIQYIKDIEEAISKSEVVVLTTAWKELIEGKQLWAGKRFIDGRYVFGNLETFDTI